MDEFEDIENPMESLQELSQETCQPKEINAVADSTMHPKLSVRPNKRSPWRLAAILTPVEKQLYSELQKKRAETNNVNKKIRRCILNGDFRSKYTRAD